MALLILKGKKDMKKIVLMLVALVSMTTMAFAEGENAKAANEAAAYDMSVNYSKLANALGLSIDQWESVEDERKGMVDKAIEKNLKYMRYILNSNQYSKYLQLLNATMNNRGLNN